MPRRGKRLNHRRGSRPIHVTGSRPPGSPSQARTLRVPDNDGSSRVWKSPGYASFVLDGQNLKLQALLTPDGKELSFLFRDATAGKETYGAGRFLEADLSKSGKVIVDFNKAYNPSCAFNPLYICPIPP